MWLWIIPSPFGSNRENAMFGRSMKILLSNRGSRPSLSSRRITNTWRDVFWALMWSSKKIISIIGLRLSIVILHYSLDISLHARPIQQLKSGQLAILWTSNWRKFCKDTRDGYGIAHSVPIPHISLQASFKLLGFGWVYSASIYYFCSLFGPCGPALGDGIRRNCSPI